LLLGRLHGDEAEAAEAHVAGCPRCADALAALGAEDPLVEAVRAARAEHETCPDLVLLLIRQLKKLGTHDTVTHVPKGTPTEPGAFEFLDPPRGGEEMGWLGPYRVLRLLGTGGMGVVFLAADPRLKRQVALKAIKPQLLARGDLRDRFLKEARAVALVEHENIVAIHDISEQHGVPYLVMPLLRGESLESRLRRVKGPLPIDDALRIGRDVASGLAAAHAQGLIHRDIKPGNIFLCEQKGAPDRAKVLDFGLARVLSDEEPGRPPTGLLVGTPAFMSPEQAAGLPADGRSDLFSLGCVLYRLAAGRQAFPATDLFALLVQIATEQPTPPAKVNPKVPAELSRLIQRLLAKKPEDRPAQAEEVVAALKKIEADRQSRRSRRHWLMTAAGVAATAGGVMLWRPHMAPGDVTIELDEPAANLTLAHLDEVERIAVDGRFEKSLPPGDYFLRAADETAKRQPWPAHFVVKPGTPLTVKLRLVGERCHNEHPVHIVALVCSPVAGDDRVLGASNDLNEGVLVWDGSSTKAPSTWFTGHGQQRVMAVAFSPDGRTAASGAGWKTKDPSPILLWDVQTLAVRAILPVAHSSWAQALAFSPDGRRLASGGNDGKAYIWNLETRNKYLPLMGGHGGSSIFAVAFTPDGKRLLTAGSDGKVLLWDAFSGRDPEALPGHSGKVRSVAATDELAVTAGTDGTVRVWDLKTRQGRVLCEHGDAVLQAIFTADRQRVLWCGADGAVRLNDLASGGELYHFAGHNKGPARGVACTADGRRAVSCGQDGLRVWELPR
jgi:WD40 repeat protein